MHKLTPVFALWIAVLVPIGAAAQINALDEAESDDEEMINPFGSFDEDEEEDPFDGMLPEDEGEEEGGPDSSLPTIGQRSDEDYYQMPAGLGTGNVIVILPESYGVPEEVATSLFQQLVIAVVNSATFDLVEIPPQRWEDLAYDAGCVDFESDDCYEMVNYMLDADYMIQGSLEGTGGAYILDLSLFSLTEYAAYNRFHTPIYGTQDDFMALLPVLARAPLYGRVGQVNLSVTPPDALVEFDSEPVEGVDGVYTISAVELGPHLLRISHPDFFVYRETIVVDLRPVDLVVDLVPTTEQIEVSGGRLWTWIALGTGVAVTGAGVAFGLLTDSTQSNFNTEASRVQVDLTELQDLQDSGEQQALLTNVLLGTGGALIVTGIILFFVEDSGEVVIPSSEDGEDTTVTFLPHFGDNAYGFQLGIEY